MIGKKIIILGNTSIAAPIIGLFYVAPALCSIACVLHLDMIGYNVCKHVCFKLFVTTWWENG